MTALAAVPSTPFQRVTRGPQIGVPPSLEQVPVDRLHVDESYQRATDGPGSRKIIVDMVKNWDWSLCQPLVIARRDDGSLWILDGQHRHAGATERGDIPFLPCVILSSLDLQGEARTFVKLNTERQKLNQAQIFHGMLAAGDPDAKAVQLILDETGWKVVRSSGTNNWRAGDMQCAPMLVKALKYKGDATIRFALTTLRAAYPETPVRQSATLLKALFDTFEMLMDEGGSPRALVAAISAVSPDAWPGRGVAFQEANPNVSATNAIARAMMRSMRGAPEQRSPASTPIRATPAAHPAVAKVSTTILPARPVPRAIAPAKLTGGSGGDEFAFGTNGKGWCTQCEQLVSREKVVACRSAFCKARATATAA